MNTRLPFIAAIVSGAITGLATLFFFKEYIGLMIVVILIALLLIRFQPWAFIAAFLVGLAFEFFERGRMFELNIVLVLLFGGSLLQIAAYLTEARHQRGAVRATMRLNVAVALVGVAASRVVQYATCPPGSPVSIDAGMMEWITAAIGVMHCHAKQGYDMIIANPDTESTFGLLNRSALYMLRSFALSSVLWASAFAALAQVIAIREPWRIGRQMFFGLVGVLAAGFAFWLVFVIIIVVGTVIYGGLAFMGLVSTDIEYQTLTLEATGLILIIMLSLDAFVSSLGAGWGASRGLD